MRTPRHPRRRPGARRCARRTRPRARGATPGRPGGTGRTTSWWRLPPADQAVRGVDRADPTGVDDGDPVAELLASSIEWVTSRTVTPSARRSRTICQTSRRARGSRPVVSSSRIATRGRPTRASAIESRCFCPPLSCAKCRPGQGRGRAHRAARPPGAGGRRASDHSSSASRTVILGCSLLSWSCTPRTGVRASRSIRGRCRGPGPSRSRDAEPRDGLDGGRLPGAVGAEDPEDLALLDGERHVVDGEDWRRRTCGGGDVDGWHGSSLAARRVSHIGQLERAAINRSGDVDARRNALRRPPAVRRRHAAGRASAAVAEPRRTPLGEARGPQPDRLHQGPAGDEDDRDGREGRRAAPRLHDPGADLAATPASRSRWPRSSRATGSSA